MRRALQSLERERRRLYPKFAFPWSIAAALAGCAAFAPEVGRIDAAIEPVSIVGYFRHYLLHSTYGEIVRIDANRVGGDTYAVKTAPGPHLVDMAMTQVSVMNPLMFGGGRCAFVLETTPGRAYHVQPPPLSVYAQFWLQLPGLKRKRFASTISVHAAGGGLADQEYALPLDCESHELYCRVPADCAMPDADGAKGQPTACVHEAAFPVGTCNVAEPAEAH